MRIPKTSDSLAEGVEFELSDDLVNRQEGITRRQADGTAGPNHNQNIASFAPVQSGRLLAIGVELNAPAKRSRALYVVSPKRRGRWRAPALRMNFRETRIDGNGGKKAIRLGIAHGGNRKWLPNKMKTW